MPPTPQERWQLAQEEVPTAWYEHLTPLNRAYNAAITFVFLAELVHTINSPDKIIQQLPIAAVAGLLHLVTHHLDMKSTQTLLRQLEEDSELREVSQYRELNPFITSSSQLDSIPLENRVVIVGSAAVVPIASLIKSAGHWLAARNNRRKSARVSCYYDQ